MHVCVCVQSYRLNEYIVLSVEQVNTWVLVQGFDILSRRGCKLILRHAYWGLALSDLRKVPWIWDIYAVYCYITNHPICMIFFTPSAGLRPGDTSWPLWAPWMRCLWTSSLADGSVQKWSDVLSLVYSRAQGPTIDEKILISHKTNYVIKKSQSES